jgi:cell wall-associated NlpC family hydrolase
MKRCSFLLLLVIALLMAHQANADTSLNIHWVPNTTNGTSTHATSTVSGNIWVNVVSTDNNQMTMDTITISSAWYRENAHNAPQIPISLTSTSSCSECNVNYGDVKSMDPSVIFYLAHNAQYTFHAEGTVRHTLMYPPFTYTEEDFNITKNVTANNILFTSSPDDVILWDPATMTSVTISSSWSDAQVGKCSLTYDIYSTGGGLVYTKQFTDLNRPGSNTWNWDGKNSQGVTVEKGIYTVKATVASNIPTISSDCNRSSYLEIMRVNYDAEYLGVDDNGTPGIGNDDKYLFCLKSYKLKDTAGLDASEGVVRLYDPSLSLVASWNINTLECLTHGGVSDGLDADASGLLHKLLIKVPISLMQTDGDYIFLSRIKDSHANDYKGHTNRWALEISEKAKIPKLVMVTPPENLTTVYVGETSGTKENRVFYKQFIADTVPAVNGLSVVFFMGNEYATVTSGSNGRYTTNNWNITTKRSPKTIYATSNGAKQSGNATIHFKKNGQLITCAPDFIGSQYVSGGNGPYVFDCSGFLYWLYNYIGIPLADNTAQGYYTSSTKIDEEDLLPGDWIFFDWGSTPPSSGSIDHTGVYKELSGGNKVMIHAHSTRGVETLTFDSSYENHSNGLYGHYYGSNERF